jgi:hypothetical protein
MGSSLLMHNTSAIKSWLILKSIKIPILDKEGNKRITTIRMENAFFTGKNCVAKIQ